MKPTRRPVAAPQPPTVPQRGRRASPVVLRAFLVGLALILLGSCAGLPRPVETPEPLALLAEGSPLYLRLGGAAVRELAPDLLEAEALDRAGPLLRDLELAAVALRPSAAAASPAASAATLAAASVPAFEAALVGNYSKGRLEFGLFFDRNWRRIGTEYRNEAQGLGLAIPRDGLILARSLGAQGIGEPTAAEPYPATSLAPWLSALISSRAPELLLWLPAPLSAGGLLSGRLAPGGATAGLGALGLELPIEDLVALGTATGGDAAEGPQPDGAPPEGASPEGAQAPRRYRLTLVARMRDERSARLFRPALSLAYYAFSRGSPLLEEAPPPNFRAEGAFIIGEGLELDAESLGELLGGLR